MHCFNWHNIKEVKNMSFVKILYMVTLHLSLILPNLDFVISEVLDKGCSSFLKINDKTIVFFENMQN